MEMRKAGQGAHVDKTVGTLPAEAEAEIQMPKGHRKIASAKSTRASHLETVAKTKAELPAQAEAREVLPKGHGLNASAITSISKGQGAFARKRRAIAAQGDATVEVRAAMPKGSPPAASAVAIIKHLGSHRRFLIKQKIRVQNGVGGKVRTALGWTPTISKEESTKIAKRAAKIIRAVERNEIDTLSDDDRKIVDECGSLILVGVKMREPAEIALADVEKAMEKLSRDTAGNDFRKSVNGFGELGLAIIIAETTITNKDGIFDLSSYPKKGHVWKRLGLAVIGGERQRRYSDVDLAEAHGYNPRRRAEMWTLADSLLKAQWCGDKDEDGNDPKKTGKEIAIKAHALGPYGEAYAYYKTAGLAKEGWTKNHAHQHARRCMFKRLIRDLWKAWKQN